MDLVGGPGGDSPASEHVESQDDLGVHPCEESPRHVSTKIMTQFTQLMVITRDQQVWASNIFVLLHCNIHQKRLGVSSVSHFLDRMELSGTAVAPRNLQVGESAARRPGGLERLYSNTRKDAEKVKFAVILVEFHVSIFLEVAANRARFCIVSFCIVSSRELDSISRFLVYWFHLFDRGLCRWFETLDNEVKHW